MNNEDFVSYELALKLKVYGFDEPCDHCYAKTSDSEHEFVGMTTSRDYNKPRDGGAAQQDASENMNGKSEPYPELPE